MDDHQPGHDPDDLVHLGHVDDAVGIASTVGAEDAPADSGPIDDPQPAWVPSDGDALPTDATYPDGPDAWVDADGPGIGDTIALDDGNHLPHVLQADLLHPLAGSGDDPIQLGGADGDSDDDRPRPGSDADLPGLAPPEDVGATHWDGSDAAIADPMHDVLGFDAAGGDEEIVDVGLDGDADGDGDGGLLLSFGDSFDITDVADESTAWTAAGLIVALGTAAGAGAVAHARSNRSRLRERGAIEAVEQLEDAGADARVEHSDLAALERALATGDRVLISHFTGPGSDAGAGEHALAVCAVDRAAGRVLLAPADPEPDEPNGATGAVPSSGHERSPVWTMDLGTFVGSWADRAGEIVIVEGAGDATSATEESARVLLLPVAVTDGLLRPVEVSP